ncbi:copper homeostasis protein CutC [Negadavirga shengliensis]|uniref:PF03932 family protein CutC n=1 Tax=Negadavirga shengliensis TaxID=1389218 RepID=A0ABV9T3Q7_9BACT
MGKVLLEAPVYTLEAALNAEKYGVDRLELCADFAEGGTTPSAGMLTVIKRKIRIPVFVMIRPRGGDFVYLDEELEAMKQDIRILADCGADGFVFGVLSDKGKVNEAACKVLVESADGRPCTFHRAFDLLTEMEEALETIIGCGFQRLLTSGGKNSVGEGIDNVLKIMEKGGDRITVMPGGGTKATHLPVLFQSKYLKEIHASCKTYRDSKSIPLNAHLLLSLLPENEGKILTIDRDKVRQIKAILSDLEKEAR